MRSIAYTFFLLFIILNEIKKYDTLLVVDYHHVTFIICIIPLNVEEFN